MVKIVDGYSFFFLCMLELMIPKRKIRPGDPQGNLKTGRQCGSLCVCFFLGRGNTDKMLIHLAFDSPGL